MRLNKKDVFYALIMLSLIASLVYLITRTVLFLFAGYTAIEKFFSLLLTLGESFVLIHGLGYVLNVLRAFRNPEGEKAIYSLSGEEPSVAILVAARHEPKGVLENTFIALKTINYRNKCIYFLDDSSDEKYKKEAEELARDYDLILFRREERHGAKAGIINDCLKNLTEEYVAIFDADQNPLPEFLNILIPIMEKDEEMGFIQTPQFYSNIQESRVARGAGFQQSVFYEYICEGKNTGGAMFCCGTNVVFRRRALLDVGGLDESTVTEDFATSVKLHSRGWKSLYYNHVCAFGMGPENLTGYFKQQFRWATGTMAIFKKLVWRFLTRPFSLKPIQWWEYFLSSTYYLVGLAFFFLMICPIMYLLFRIPSFFAKPEIYFLAFLPYIGLSVSVFYMVLGTRNYNVKDLFLGQLLAISTFSIYLRAAFSSLLGFKTTFGITEKAKGKAIPYPKLWPQMTMMFLSFIAVIWGINRFIYEREPALLVNGFWALYHFVVLSSIFYFNEEEPSKISCKRLLKGVRFEYRVIENGHELEDLSKETWRDCFTVFLPECLKTGTLIMCKVNSPDKEAGIFDGKVIWSSGKKGRNGFETSIGLVTASEEDKDKLRKVMRR